MLRSFSLARTRLTSLSSSASPFYYIHSSTYSSKKNNQEDVAQSDAVSLLNRDPTSPPRLFLVQPRLRPPKFLQAKLNEALCLANSLEEQREGCFVTDFYEKELPPHVIVQNPVLKSSKPRADTYFGPGTVENIKIHINAAESEEEVDAVYVNAILTGVQQRNLERVWERPVLDRVGLIIEIFNAHAHTKEAKLQAELAALMYKKSRLVRIRGPDGRQTFGQFGEAEVVSARGRGSGGRGFISGAGETELQLQRRRIIDRRNHLLSHIEEVRRTRSLQRAARRRRGGLEGQGLPTVAVVGYTNAGKSTLISALSNTYLYSNERLFATLDPRLKSIVLPSGRKILLSDTVGFISDLPIQLVKAFQSTLEEVVEADLLLHVVDSTAPNLEEHRSTVFQVLNQLGVPEEKLNNMIEVWNKIDYEEEEEMDDNTYLHDDQEEHGSLSGHEDEEDPIVETAQIDHEEQDPHDNQEETSSLSGPENEEQPITVGTKDDKQDCSSDGWLLSDDDKDDDLMFWKVPEDHQTDLQMKTDVQSIPLNDPDVKISALNGIGLQELLEVIAERLKDQDEELKSRRIVESNDIFGRKWRPSRKEDKETAVEE